jgi:cytochrome c peroxidase
LIFGVRWAEHIFFENAEKDFARAVVKIVRANILWKPKLMKGHKHFYVILLLSGMMIVLSFVSDRSSYYKFVIPEGWPKPVYNIKRVGITEQGFKLGKMLFNDPVLSKDNSTSCASCHLQFTAFTHADHNLSHGIYGRKGTRNSIALFNLAWNTSFMWDGGVTDLEKQPVNPITNPAEMDNKMPDLVAKLNKLQKYRKLFFDTYNDSVITQELLLRSLMQFTIMIESFNSKYDSVTRGQGNVKFTESEQNGYAVFKKNCSSCHAEPLFTDRSFKNNGLTADTALNDFGRMKVTGDKNDSLKFRVPSLRNVASSAPYMHDGRFKRLIDVLDHYTNGIEKSPTLAKELNTKIALTDTEKTDLIAFLNTLTDKLFLYDVRFRDYGPQ